jgi:hypothetical protein
LRMVGWPVAVGMLAHALRWWTLAGGAGFPKSGTTIVSASTVRRRCDILSTRPQGS